MLIVSVRAKEYSFGYRDPSRDGIKILFNSLSSVKMASSLGEQMATAHYAQKARLDYLESILAAKKINVIQVGAFKVN